MAIKLVTKPKGKDVKERTESIIELYTQDHYGTFKGTDKDHLYFDIPELTDEGWPIKGT